MHMKAIDAGDGQAEAQVELTFHGKCSFTHEGID
jgi:hypothetical protein